MRVNFRSITKRLGAVIKDKAAPLVDKGSSVAANAASTAFQKGKHAVDKGSSALSRSAATAYRKGKIAAMDTARAASKEMSDQATEATRKASKKASETISEGKKASTIALRWLWWWSLAAVGIYGIATTVPKELVRIGFDSMAKKKDDGEETSSKAREKEGEGGIKESKPFWG